MLIIFVSIIMYGFAVANIIGDPSRTLKTMNIIDDFANSGLFIRNVGTLSTSESKYQLVIPIIFGEYDQSFMEIKYEIDNMIFQYDTLFNKTAWPNQFNLSEFSIDTSMGIFKQQFLFEVEKCHSRLTKVFIGIYEDFLNIKRVFQDVNSTRRVPRGVLNFLGEGFRWMFGLATESQLNAVKVKVIQTQNSGISVVKSMKHMVSVIKNHDLEINNLEKTTLSIQNHTYELIHELKTLVYGAAAQSFEIFKLNTRERLSHFESQTFHVLTSLSRKIQLIHQTVQFALQGKLSSDLLSPTVLYNLLIETQNFLPPHFIIPKIANGDAFYNFYKLLNVQIERGLNDSKLIVVDLPILNDADIFQLNLVTVLGVPFSPHSETTARINLENNKIYAINLNNNRGFSFDFSAIKHSKKFLMHYYGNFKNYVLEDQEKIDCILDLQLGKNQYHNCKKNISSEKQYNVISHLHADRWGYSMRGSKAIQIVCLNEGNEANNTKNITLTGLGEVRIPLHCDMYLNDKKLTGLFLGHREVDVPSITKIFQSDFPPAALAFSPIWSNLEENITHFDMKKLSDIQRDTQNQISYTIRHTQIHNQTKMLLNKIDNLLQKPMNQTFEPWYSIDPPTKKEYILISLTILSFVLHFITFFIIQSNVRNLLLKFLRQIT